MAYDDDEDQLDPLSQTPRPRLPTTWQNVFKRRQPRPVPVVRPVLPTRGAYPVVMNDPGVSGRDTRSSDVIGSVGSVPSAQAPQPIAPQDAVRPRSFRDALQQRMAQPPSPAPQAGTVDLGQGSTYTPQGTGTSRDRRTEPRDYAADDEAYLRDLQKQKGPFWKRLAAASIRAGQAASGQEISPLLTSQERDVAQAQQQLGQDLTLGRAQAQGQILKNRQAQQDEREVNNALTQYNRLEHFDPDDPADAGFAQYFRDRGLTLPKKDKYHRPIASWVNGRLILTDNKGTRQALEDNDPNRPLVDTGRVPNEAGLTPSQQSTVTTATANRNATNTRSANQIAAANQRAAQAQAGQNQRAGMRASGTRGVSVDRVTDRRAKQLAGQIDAARLQMQRADERGNKTEKLKAQSAGEKAAMELNALDAGYEAGPGEGGYPYYKPKGQATQPAPQGGITEAQIRAAAAAKGLDPDTAVQRARARNLIQ